MKYYRIVDIELLSRVPFDGLHGNRTTQRTSIDGTKAIVERKEGYTTNERWMNHDDALLIVATPEWTEQNEEW